MKIKDFLQSLGIERNYIMEKAGTGVVCDIVGTAPEVSDNEKNCVHSVAFVAGMNAISIEEQLFMSLKTGG